MFLHPLSPSCHLVVSPSLPFMPRLLHEAACSSLLASEIYRAIPLMHMQGQQSDQFKKKKKSGTDPYYNELYQETFWR